MSKYNEYKAKAIKLDRIIDILNDDSRTVGTAVLVLKRGEELSLTLDKTSGEFRINRYKAGERK